MITTTKEIQQFISSDPARRNEAWQYPNPWAQAYSPFRLPLFYALNILGIGNLDSLAQFLNISLLELEGHVNFPQYKSFVIPKKKGGGRSIQAPGPKLKLIQQKINRALQHYYLLIKPEPVNGFVINTERAYYSSPLWKNAKIHTNRCEVLNIDLQNFFPSISASRVYNLFLSEHFSFPKEVAQALALLCTYERCLPTGAPTSPVVSNFISLGLDDELTAFCNRHQLYYTRYADDLTFSSDKPISAETILFLSQIINDNGFVVNQKKLRISGGNSRQVVTGLTVNDKVNVNREFLKKTRAMLFDLRTNGLTTATSKHYTLGKKPGKRLQNQFLAKLKGNIEFIGQIRGRDDRMYLTMKKAFAK